MTNEDIQKIKTVLKTHWITAIICDETTHTDRVGCWCGEWRCEPQPNVGAAVDRWIEHVAEFLR